MKKLKMITLTLLSTLSMTANATTCTCPSGKMTVKTKGNIQTISCSKGQLKYTLPSAPNLT